MNDRMTLPMRWPVAVDDQGRVVMAPATLSMETNDSRDGFVTKVTLTYPVKREGWQMTSSPNSEAFEALADKLEAQFYELNRDAIFAHCNKYALAASAMLWSEAVNAELKKRMGGK